MPEGSDQNSLGVVLKELLKERSLSMRKLSEFTEIHPATISRIVNGKRKASPEHLQKFADCLEVPLNDLFIAAGYPVEQKREMPKSEMYMVVESIQNMLESSSLCDKQLSVASVEEKLASYEQFTQTEEGNETILKGFEEKLQKVGSIGPFISNLKDMYERFRLKKGTARELAIIGAGLLYFIIPVDVVPDYVFPIGYLDDAIAVQLVMSFLYKLDT